MVNLPQTIHTSGTCLLHPFRGILCSQMILELVFGSKTSRLFPLRQRESTLPSKISTKSIVLLKNLAAIFLIHSVTAQLIKVPSKRSSWSVLALNQVPMSKGTAKHCHVDTLPTLHRYPPAATPATDLTEHCTKCWQHRLLQEVLQYPKSSLTDETLLSPPLFSRCQFHQLR